MPNFDIVYADRFLKALEQKEAAGIGRVAAWRMLFQEALVADGYMCLCGALGASSLDLPPAVVLAARQFFERGLVNLTSGPAETAVSAVDAKRVLAMLEGSMLLAITLGDLTLFDETSALLC